MTRTNKTTAGDHSLREDYAARIRNLPLLEGTEPVEEELKKRLEDATGQLLAWKKARKRTWGGRHLGGGVWGGGGGEVGGKTRWFPNQSFFFHVLNVCLSYPVGVKGGRYHYCAMLSVLPGDLSKLIVLVVSQTVWSLSFFLKKKNKKKEKKRVLDSFHQVLVVPGHGDWVLMR